MWLKGLLATAAIAVVTSIGAQAQTVGVTDTSIKIGNTSPYSGPASAYGAIGKAYVAYFQMVNDRGGITSKDGKTRKVDFISLDDGYTPPRTVEQTRKLVEQEHVAFTAGQTGTASNSAIHRYMNAKKVPQLFVATGASKWAQPQKFPWTIGFQPGYDIEGQIYAKYILATVKDPKIAILFQNDDYGKDYRDGFIAELGDKAKDMIVKALPYEVTDPTVDAQMLELAATGANVFFNVSTPKFAAQAIRKACEIGWKPLQILNNVSSSVGATLRPAGLDCSQGLITAQYMRDPTDPQWHDTDGYKEWAAFMDKYLPNADRTDISYAYGYSLAYLIDYTLTNCADLSRPGIMHCAADVKDLQIPMLIPGILINTSPTDFHTIQAEQLSRFEGDRWVLFGNIIEVSQ
ncbi:MAG: ABC transporter substrate-binding protein [Alphaproteobacteria bacterium]|nr:ABC transporter substrate-binding protein [Alphaproteobacteria bacterium]MCB9930979.1 ABC transporter substrate-binding protein [Alphaproteobacteria bacterium]